MASEDSRNRLKRQGRDFSSEYRPAKAQRSQYEHSTWIEYLDAKHPSTGPYPEIPPLAEAVPSTMAPAYPPPLPPLPSHLASAPFTHASSTNDRLNSGMTLNYERLEFLGDAYLEVIATRLIVSRFPMLPVGRQSLLREKLVRNSTLARFARLYHFENRVHVVGGSSYPQSTKKVEKILADMVEAYIGALILAGKDAASTEERAGFEIAEEWMTALWVPVLLEEEPNDQVIVNRKDELVREIGGKFIVIEYVQEKFSEHQGIHSSTVGVYLTGWGYEKMKLGEGTAMNKKEAGMKAAEDALDNGGPLLEMIKDRKKKSDEERRAQRAENAADAAE